MRTYFSAVPNILQKRLDPNSFHDRMEQSTGTCDRGQTCNVMVPLQVSKRQQELQVIMTMLFPPVPNFTVNS